MISASFLFSIKETLIPDKHTCSTRIFWNNISFFMRSAETETVFFPGISAPSEFAYYCSALIFPCQVLLILMRSAHRPAFFTGHQQHKSTVNCTAFP